MMLFCSLVFELKLDNFGMIIDEVNQDEKRIRPSFLNYSDINFLYSEN